MGGLILLAILVGWFFFVKTISYAVVDKMNDGFKKTLVLSVTFIILLSAPVMDEIIGGFQFRALCSPENLLVYDAGRVRGAALQYKETPNYHITNKVIPIHVTHSQWVAPESGEVLIDHKIIYAKAGFVLGLTGWTDSFNGHCDVREYYQLFDKFDIKKIQGNYGEL